MKTELRTITPVLAEYYLSKNTENRKLTNKNIDALVRVLRNGEWVVNGETIKFNVKGQLIDGQHRLWACVISGIPFKSLCVDEVSDLAFMTIDVGAKRTAADILSIGQVNNSNTMAAIVKCYVESKISHSFVKSNVMATHLQIINEYNRDAEMYERLLTLHTGIRKFVTTSFMAVCKAAIEKYGDHWLEESIEKIRTGEGLTYGDPCHTLREWSINNKGSVKTQNTRAIYVKSVKAMAIGKQIKYLRHTAGDPFPTF